MLGVGIETKGGYSLRLVRLVAEEAVPHILASNLQRVDSQQHSVLFQTSVDVFKEEIN